MRQIDIFAYAVAALFALAVWLVEKVDMRCPSFHSTAEECDAGGGMPYSHSKPAPDDTVEQLLDKIDNAATYDRKTIKWRRAIMFSFVISLLICTLVFGQGGLVEWYKFYTCIIIGFAVLYWTANYYSYHFHNQPEDNVTHATSEIRKKMK